jgi:D-apionolactonase
MAVSRAVKFYGTDEPVAKSRELRAGDLTATFDNGALRTIRYRGIEVLRGISYLVRDKNWGTYGAVISNLNVRQSRAGFTISYRAECKDSAQVFHYDARVEGNGNTIRFSATGFPKTDVLTNRTGFVVLHPLEGVVGAPVEIVHTDGRTEKSRFPAIISPGQPVFEIRSLKYSVMPVISATVLMEGNKFEMEDHRNWMDASYKTYVCSLLDPWPYTLPKDKAFEQSITLTIAGKSKPVRPVVKPGAIEISIGRKFGKLPRVGAGVPMQEAKAALAAAGKIKSLQLSTLVCQIDGRQKGQVEAARAFAELSRFTGVPVKLEIILAARASAQEEMAAIAGAARKGGLEPASVVVTQVHDLKSFQPNTTRPWGPTYEEMAKAARNAFPNSSIGGGMLSYFTELNRKPVPKGLFDFVTHTVCPIVHAADDISVMETLEALPSIFSSARRMIGKTPYHLGPSGISCRDNPYGAAVADNPDNRRVCLAPYDPRQRGLFAAAWNVGLAAAAARDGLDEIALGAATGPQGVISGDVFHPAAHVLGVLGSLSGKNCVRVTSSAPSSVIALAGGTRECTSVLAANLTPQAQPVRFVGLSGKVMLRMLDATNFGKAGKMESFLNRGPAVPVKAGRTVLAPYAVAYLVQT